MNQRKPRLQLLLVDSISRRQRRLFFTARLLADVAVVAGANAALSTHAQQTNLLFCSFLALFFCLSPPLSTKTQLPHTRPNAVSPSTTRSQRLCSCPKRPLTAIKKHKSGTGELSHILPSGGMQSAWCAGDAPNKPGARSVARNFDRYAACVWLTACLPKQAKFTT
jgi:hypothetical protein